MILLKQVLISPLSLYYTTPHETVICDSDNVTGTHISQQLEKYYFLNNLLTTFY
jgi:hypothetical protein